MRIAKYFCALSLVSLPLLAAEDPILIAPTQLVTELVPYEIWDPILVDNGIVWVGQIKKNDQDSFKIEAYTQDGMQRLGVAGLSHSTIRLFKLPNNRVAVLGRTSYPHRSKMTTVWIEDGRIRTAPVSVPDDFTYNAMLHRGVWYGVDPGENAFFSFNQNRVSRYSGIYSMPDKMLGIGNEAWIVEKRDVGSGDEVLSVTDLTTGVRKSVFDTGRNGLYNFTKSVDDKFVIATASVEQNVFLIDVESKKLRSTLHLDHTPFGLTPMGRCFVTANGESQTLSVIKLDGTELGVVETWDVSSAGQRLKSPTQLGYDAVHKSVFVKSSYTCPSCTISQASVFRVKAPVESVTNAACLD